MTTRVSRFFVDQDIGVGREIHLEGRACHYLKNVLRLRENDSVILFNGRGGEFHARISSVQRDYVLLDVLAHDTIERESFLPTELGLAVIKREAMDAAIRKATELGVTRIVPLLTDFTTVAHKQAQRRAEHWQEIIHSACEQSGRNSPPELQATMGLSAWLDLVSSDLKLMADPRAPGSLDDLPATPSSVALLSGPEGGFSDEERGLTRERGFQAVSLGSRILRADTAPLAMLALIQHKWGDLSAAGINPRKSF